MVCMNDGELKHRVNQVMYELMTSTGVVAPVDVLQRLVVLPARPLHVCSVLSRGFLLRMILLLRHMRPSAASTISLLSFRVWVSILELWGLPSLNANISFCCVHACTSLTITCYGCVDF